MLKAGLRLRLEGLVKKYMDEKKSRASDVVNEAINVAKAEVEAAQKAGKAYAVIRSAVGNDGKMTKSLMQVIVSLFHCFLLSFSLSLLSLALSSSLSLSPPPPLILVFFLSFTLSPSLQPLFLPLPPSHFLPLSRTRAIILHLAPPRL